MCIPGQAGGPRLDLVTIKFYDAQAASLAAQYEAMRPHGAYDMMERYFHPRGRTADIGCGSGRDVAWLSMLGHRVMGYDASEGMLRQARDRHPTADFQRADLPGLPSIAAATFDNVLALAVLMHLDAKQIEPACRNLVRIARPGGRIMISVRTSRDKATREHDGRLFTPIYGESLAAIWGRVGTRVLATKLTTDAERPGVQWTSQVVERSP